MSEIGADLSSSKPMHRLLQGEVGSGKAQPIHSLVLAAERLQANGGHRSR
jgi:ATP-dependent DNA helicase RecG